MRWLLFVIAVAAVASCGTDETTSPSATQPTVEPSATPLLATDPVELLQCAGPNIHRIDVSKLEVKVVANGYGAKWSPDGKFFAYGGCGGIAIQRADSTRPEHVAQINDASWEWSPDGSMIVGGGNGFSNGVLSLVTGVDSGDFHVQDFYTGRIESKSWSPDSSHVAFSENDRGELGVLDVASGDVSFHAIPGNPGFISEVIWSPKDNQLVAVVHHEPVPGSANIIRLWLIDTTNDEARKLADGGSFAQWSPDGMRLIYTHNSSVYEVSLNGEGPRVILDTTYAQLSPDGTLMTFVDGTCTEYAAYVASSNGQNAVQVAAKATGFPILGLTWSPDSRRLVFVHDATYVVRSDGHELTRVAGRLEHFAWSPDGRHILAQDIQGHGIGCPE